MIKSRGFDYIKHAYRYFNPHTPKAALLAIEQGLLPHEAYIYRASSIKPLYEEPFDTHEIDRILARPDIDLETLLLIIRILQKLIVSKDSETALFAAESLNRIESRFTDRIEKLRGDIEQEPDNSRHYYELGKTYFEFAQISGERETLRNFYLREAYEQLKEVINVADRPQKEDYILLIKVLITLGLYDQAQSIIREGGKKHGRDADFLLLWTECAFYLRDFTTVRSSCEKLDKFELDEDTKMLVDFWRGML